MPSQHASKGPQSAAPAKSAVKVSAAPAPRAWSTPTAQLIDNPNAARPADILSLQHRVGNRAVQRLLASRRVQRKLQVGPAEDAYEREADRVMTMPAPPTPRAPLQRQPEEEEPVRQEPIAQRKVDEEEELRAKHLDPRASFEAGSAVEEQLAVQQGAGAPLPHEVRAFMEPRFGADFGGVRLHTDSGAAQLNQELHARAFTHGQDIYLGEGQYAPGTDAGKRLLAHELTHVVQQTGRTQSPAVRRETDLAELPTTKEAPPKFVSDAPAMNLLAHVPPPVPKVGSKVPPPLPERRSKLSSSLAGPGQEQVGKILKGKVPPPLPKRRLKVPPRLPTRRSKLSPRPTRPGQVQVGQHPDRKVRPLLPPRQSKGRKLLPEERQRLTKLHEYMGGKPGLAKPVKEEAEPTEVAEAIKTVGDVIDIGGKPISSLGEISTTESDTLDKFSQISGVDKETLAQSSTNWGVAAGVLGGVGGVVGMLTGGLGSLAGFVNMVSGLAKWRESKGKEGWDSTLEGLTDFLGGSGGTLVTTGQVGTGIVATVFKGLKDATTSGILSAVGSGLGVVKGAITGVAGSIKTVIKFVKVIVAAVKDQTTFKGMVKDLFAVYEEGAGAAKGFVDMAKGTVDTIKGFLDALKAVSDVGSAVMGIVSACIALVSNVIDFILGAIRLGMQIFKIFQTQKTEKQLKQKVKKRPELENALRQIEEPSRVTALTEDDNSNDAKIAKAVRSYERASKGAQSNPAKEQALKLLREHLLTRNLMRISQKRQVRSLGSILDSVTTINFNLASSAVSLGAIISSIAGVASGVGAGIGLAVTAVLNIVNSILTLAGSLLPKLSSFARQAFRGVKQYIVDISPKWAKRLGFKGQTTAAKKKKRAQDAMALLNMMAGLPKFDEKDGNVVAEYQRAMLFVEATGVDLTKLYEKNGEPKEQGQLLMAAMKERA